jgi:hypothetical protein
MVGADVQGGCGIAHARRWRMPHGQRPGRLRDVLDHLYELVAAVPVTPGELHKLAGPGENGAAPGGCDDGNPRPQECAIAAA